jgi:serine/threonine-protein kinase
MYVMFTSRVPFEADSYMGVLTQHMFVKPTPPSQVMPGDGPGLGALETVALRALEKKPEDRYQSMTELALAIDRAITVAPDGTVLIAPGTATMSRPAPKLLDVHLGAPASEEDALGDGRLSHAKIPAPSRWPLVVGATLVAGLVAGLVFWARAGGSSGGNEREAKSATQASAPAASAAFPRMFEVAAAGASSSAPASSAAQPSAAAPRTIRITTSPSFAEVWFQGARVGTTPFDAPEPAPKDPTVDTPTPRYLLRLAGYEERAVALSEGQGDEVHIDLAPKAAPPPAPAKTLPSSPRRAPAVGELGDPWSKP